MNYKPCLFILLLLFTVQSCDDLSSCFLKKLFDFSYPQENVYPISLTNNASVPSHKVLAYGDLNNDLRADYVAISQDNDVLVFYYQTTGDDQGLYQLVFTAQQFVGCAPVNAYLYDVNDDKTLDITIWGAYSNGSNCLYPLLQNQSGYFVPEMQLPKQFGQTTQPILFETIKSLNQLSGQKTTSLLLYDSDYTSRIILFYGIKEYIQIEWKQLFLNNINEQVAFSDQHWNSFIDLTGDCYGQIILTNMFNQIQFWVYTTNGFVLVKTLKLNTLGITQMTSLSFSDVDYDGRYEIIIANTTYFMIFYSNLQASDQFCLPSKTTFSYNWQDITLVQPPQNCTVKKQNIHFGDLNIDGYPDLLFRCQSKNVSQIWLYQNRYSHDEYFQTFEDPYQQAFNKYINSHTDNVTGVSLFDILQNGIIDIIVTVGSHKTVFLYNNYLYQNYFFIKGLATNGNTTNQGAQVVGASFYWLNSLGNTQRTAIYSQMSQTAYGATPMPYVLTGLGKANNYVEQFTLGRLGSQKQWSPIIPNSQLAVFSGSVESSTWGIKIFILPTDSIVYVLIVCIIILAILGLVLVILKCGSKKEENVLLQDYM